MESHSPLETGAENELNPVERELIDFVRAAGRGVQVPSAAEGFKNLKGRIAASQPVPQQVRQTSHVSRFVALGLCLALVFVGVRYIPSGKPAQRTKTYTTDPGQRAKITLASGAQVTLAPATTLTINGNEVKLDGRAVFTVLHSGRSPFTVRTQQAVVKVLGTAFSVTAYNSDPITRVVVAEGKVSANQAVLSASDAADITISGTSVSHGTDISPDFVWTEGRLVFSETPLSEVVRELGRWYNVKITIQDAALKDRPITTTFVQDKLTTAELDMFAEATGLRYKWSGNNITFLGR